MSNAALRRPSPPSIPHGLWSLWDMLAINSAAFLNVFYWFSRLEGMHVEAVSHDQTRGTLKGKIFPESGEPDDFVNDIKDDCEKLVAELDKLGARVTTKAVRRMLRALLDDKTLTWEELGTFSQTINSRLQDEISDVTLLTLSAKERELFTPIDPLFGKDFEAKFPLAVFELDEAAKCMALGRATAAVFHFMRIMEIAIRAVARSLQIPDPTKPVERNWGAILKAIWSGIEKKWPTTASRMHGDGEIFEAIYASLDAVKNPWRNATMHVENKYTDEEAEHVYAAVRGFMRKLSSRMDENGLPLA
jgi:hypothetical protein